MDLEIIKDKRTNKAVQLIVKEANIKLAKTPSRIFQIIYENINKPVNYVDLLNFVYEENFEETDYFKMRSVDVYLSSKIKGLSKILGYEIERDFGKSIMLKRIVK